MVGMSTVKYYYHTDSDLLYIYRFQENPIKFEMVVATQTCPNFVLYRYHFLCICG